MLSPHLILGPLGRAVRTIQESPFADQSSELNKISCG